MIRALTLAAISMLSTVSAVSADSVTPHSPLASDPVTSRPATVPAGPICVAIIEPEVLADLPTEERKAMAAAIDALLTESLSKQKGFVLVDRQALDEVLAEKASGTGGAVKVESGEVGDKLRPFWSAGVLICPVVRQVKADKNAAPGKNPVLVIDVDAVLAQTGQSLGEAHTIAKWQNHNWDKAPALEAPLRALWSALPDGLRQAQASRQIEIADVRLSSSLRRLQWMADDLGDAMRASLAQPGVALLRPRHPASTKEERLLRVMGLSAAGGKDAASTLACSPDLRLDMELSEEVGKDLDYAKTQIKISLTLQGRDGAPSKKTFSGMASQYTALSEQASAWLNKHLGAAQSTTSEALDQEHSREIAQRELEAARLLLKDCRWYGNANPDPGPDHLLRARVLEHALRAAHLDPTSEEAQRLVVQGIDSPYAMRGDGRSSVCADRVIAEGQRYLDHFANRADAAIIRHHISGAASEALFEMRQRGPGDWISLPYNPEIWRYGKVAVMGIEWDLQNGIMGNLWPEANLIGQCILAHCPPDRLEEERAYWRSYWKKTIEPLQGDIPPWEFIDINYFIRNKDSSGLHETLNELARRYPRSHPNIWWGTDPYPTQPGVYTNKPCWKVRVEQFLKLCGDKEWKTWEPTFAAETFSWNLHDFTRFAGRLNPSMPRAWDEKDALPLPGARITIDAGASLQPGRQETFRPLLVAGGFMWFCQPPLFPDMKVNQALWVAPLKELEADGQYLHVKAQAISWPGTAFERDPNKPVQLVQCWAQTAEAQVPTVWIGTNYCGLGRFEMKDGKWVARWYAAKQGIPGEDILLVRPCLHEGKRKLLILSQPRVRPTDFERFLWVLDPSNGQISTILTSRTWDTTWYKYNNKEPAYVALVAKWKDGTKVPLCLYDCRSFPKLDVADIVALDKDCSGFALVREESAQSVWRFADGSLAQFDTKWSPTWLLNSPPLQMTYSSIPLPIGKADSPSTLGVAAPGNSCKRR